MRSTDLRELTQTFRTIGDRLVKKIKEQTPKASGRLKESIEDEVVQRGNELELRIEADDYFKFVEGGRSAGKKAPPTSSIREWCLHKGIPTSAAWIIAKRIGERGIVAKDIVKKIIAAEEQRIADEIQQAAAIDLDRRINTIFTEQIGDRFKRKQ